MLAPEAKIDKAFHKPQRILIIEDEALIREAIIQSLHQENYEVFSAADGKTGLELVLRAEAKTKHGLPIDLLILDLMLPDINGLEICRLLRNQGSDIFILMISAKDNEVDRVIGLDMGADDYLPKPFGLRELIARCRALLRRCNFEAQTIDSVLRVKDIILNLKTSVVRVRGEEVYLSPRELQLLSCLMQRPHQVCSREHLIQQVWGKNFVGDHKTLDVHIRWLREKLEANPAKPALIMTIRGFGYRFG